MSEKRSYLSVLVGGVIRDIGQRDLNTHVIRVATSLCDEMESVVEFFGVTTSSDDKMDSVVGRMSDESFDFGVRVIASILEPF